MAKLLSWVAGCFLAASIGIGTFSDTPRQHTHLTLGGYQVLAADFHIHSFPLSWGVLSPWDTVIEARRQGLDVIAMAPHNHTWVAKLGQWFSRSSDAPIVLVGEEIHSIGYHLLAIGISNTIDWKQPSSSAIEAVHAQGGVAIAAHPIGSYSAYDAAAMRALDGAEVVHPLALRNEALATQLREFFGRGHFTAIGDTDYHLGPMAPHVGEMGLCRTYIFVQERTEKDILKALRERRTVVYDRERVYGDPALIQLAADDGRLPKLALAVPERRFSGVLSGVFGLLGLIGCCLTYGRRLG